MPTKTELRAKLEALLREEGASFGSDALAGAIVDLIERGNALRLDPEAPKLPNPKRLEVVRLAPEDWQRKGGWLAKVVCPGDLILAVVLGGWSAGAAERRISLLEEAVAAWNREREEEEMEAEAGSIIDEGIPKLLREEIEKEVQVRLQEERARAGVTLDYRLGERAGTDEERARCLAVFDAFLSNLPAGWDFVRLRAREARGKIENPLQCALCGKDWPHMHTPEQMAEWKARGGQEGDAQPTAETSPEWPERLMAPLLGTHRLLVMQPGNYRELTVPEWEEAARRWEEEPRLRERIGKAVGKLTKHFDLALERQVGITGNLYRILTGKES